jgi:uncharacterized protein (TIGR00369 family)
VTETIDVELTERERDRLAAAAAAADTTPAELLAELARHRGTLQRAIEGVGDREGAPVREEGRFPAPVGVLLGMEIVDGDPGNVAIEMAAGPEHANPMGTVHGGVVCDLADAAMGASFASTLDSGESFTTLELSTNFLRPVWEETLRAEGLVTHRGSTVGYVECEVTNEAGKPVAYAKSTCLVLRGERASGR